MIFFVPRFSRNLFFIIRISFSVSLLFGCASLPEQEYNEAKIWKEKVDYYNLKKYAPKDYEAGLKQYKEAESAYQKDNAKSRKSFQDAASSFNRLYDKGMSLLIAEKTEEVQNLFNANKGKEWLNTLISLNKYNLAKMEFESGKQALGNKDHTEALSHLGKSRETLKLTLDTLQLKRETDEWRGKLAPFIFMTALKADYESAQNKYLEAEKNFDDENNKAKPYYSEALVGFKAMYNTTLPASIEKSLKECELALAAAKELKAPTAFKKDYEAAVKQYEAAKSNLEKKAYENAIKEANKAKELLDAVNVKLKPKKN